MTVYARPGWRQTYVWVTDEESDRLDRIAEHWSSSRAAIVRRALSMYLDAWRDAETLASLERDPEWLNEDAWAERRKEEAM